MRGRDGVGGVGVKRGVGGVGGEGFAWMADGRTKEIVAQKIVHFLVFLAVLGSVPVRCYGTIKFLY